MDRDGYMVVSLSFKKKKYMCKVHRLVADAFIPNPDNKPTVNHKYGNKADNFVSSLEYATNLEQQIHASKLDLLANQVGESNNAAKYSNKLIKKACKLILSNQYSDYEIDRKCGFSRGYTYLLRHKKARTDVTDRFFTNKGSTTIENDDMYDDSKYYVIDIH